MLGDAEVPFLAFNSLRTDAEKNQHFGLLNPFVGILEALRNVAAYGQKLSWNGTGKDALDLLMLLSLLHQRLDAVAQRGGKS